MFGNYLKVASRNLFRHKGYSFINIVGLAIGMTCTVLILLWVQDELSFDRFHKNADRIFRVNKTYRMGSQINSNESTPYPLADAAKTGFPEIANASKCYSSRYSIKYNDKIFNENGVCLVDTSFFKIFDFTFLKGNAKTALSDPQSLILTEEMAQKYFGGEDPIGKMLILNNQHEYSVTGVIQNIPLNSELQYDFFIPIYPLEGLGSEDDWGSHYLSTWVLLRDNTNIPELENKLSALFQEHLETEQTSLRLQPLRDIHLYTPDGKSAGLKYVYFFSLIAVFILVIACVNFMSLSTARSSKRAKEVGLRKVVGATKSSLISQFLGESVLTALIAMVIALLTVSFQAIKAATANPVDSLRYE